MSLRKSPERTPALLAASRANGRKSLGLQSISRSRQRELLNGLRDGGRLARSLEVLARASLPQQLDFARLYANLHKAVAPEPSEIDLVLATAAFVWRVKRRMENRVRSPRFKAQVAAKGGRLPPPWRMPLQRPQGQVTVTVWVRPGRPPATDTSPLAGSGPEGFRSQGEPQLHVPLEAQGFLTARRPNRCPFYVGVTIRRKGRRPWQPSDGPWDPAASSSPPDAVPPSGKDATSGRNEAPLGGTGVGISVEIGECNRNSCDNVTVICVKSDKNPWHPGMSKFMNSVRSYVGRLTGNPKGRGENCEKHP